MIAHQFIACLPTHHNTKKLRNKSKRVTEITNLSHFNHNYFQLFRYNAYNGVNEFKKSPECKHILGGNNEEKISLKGKKKSIVPVIAVVLVVAVVASVLFMRSKAKGADSTEMTVQSATAEKGSVSTTVVGTGTLASSAGTDVKIPAGIEIEEVLVESGDSVEAGQKLATVNEASVASVLLEVKENIESVEDAIDDLSSDANDSTTTEYLQKKALPEL